MEQTAFSECKNPISSDVLLVPNLNCDETRLKFFRFDIFAGVTFLFQSSYYGEPFVPKIKIVSGNLNR